MAGQHTCDSRQTNKKTCGYSFDLIDDIVGRAKFEISPEVSFDMWVDSIFPNSSYCCAITL